MPFLEKRIYSGAILEIEQVSCTERGRVAGKNSATGKSSEEQKKQNLKNAKKKLMRTMCANFCKGDFFLTLTYEQNVDDVEGAHQLSNFLRRLKRFYKKQAQELKYITITERGDKYGRLHHHIICKKINLQISELVSLWGNGRVDMATLDGDPCYRWLMVYLTKNERSIKSAKLWSCSKNLAKPVEPTPKIIKRKTLKKQPVAPNGYYILDWVTRTDKRGENRYILAIRNDKRAELPKGLEEEMAKTKEEEMYWRT